MNNFEKIFAELQAGRPIVVVDDEDRENEGDLIVAAEKITADTVNFMGRVAGGLICIPITEEVGKKLEIDHMVANNAAPFSTAFAVSVDASHGITTGASTQDRAHTIRLMADRNSTAQDFVRPGHVFPLIAKKGGVLRRAGHTEAAVDLCRLAGLQPVGAIVEILNEDGTMARMPELKTFAAQHNLEMCTIQALIQYRKLREKLIQCEEIVDMPTEYGDFKLHLYRSLIDDAEHLALVKGEIDSSKPTLVRVHSECLTGDVFGSNRCDCGPQLNAAMQKISDEGAGLILYMRKHEGRGIGLAAKIHAYKLQEQGLDTVDANLKLGFPMDLRDYGIGAQILSDLGVRQIRLMTNNPKKIVGLEGHSLEIIEQIPLKIEANKHNVAYLETKRKKMGHLL